MTRVPSPRVVVLSLLCALLLVPAALADSQVRIVRLSFTDGSVQIDRNTGSFEKAIINMPIIAGTRLVTEQNGRAEVELEEGSTLRLGPDADVYFSELALAEDGGKINAVEVKQGTVYFDIAHKKNDDFRVLFAGDRITIDRSVRFRLTVAQDRVEVAALKGDLKVEGAEEVAVKSGHTLSIDPESGKFAVAK